MYRVPIPDTEDMIEVTLETGTYEGGWEYKDSADCDLDAMAVTARALWDEAYTSIQGCKRRITFTAPDGGVLRTEQRP